VPRTPARSPARPDPNALPDPLRLPWRPPGAPGPAPDPRSEAGWAAGLPDASAGERRLIEAQIGRDVRGSVAVAARCRYGLPVVVRTAPLLPDGTPFPTLYWLACPAARVAAGRLEAAGWNTALSERVATDPDLAAAHAAAHAAYLAQRDTMAPLPGNPGVGGLPGRVKCLHALYAHQAATGVNPIGRIVSQVIDPIDCPGPCATLDPARAAVAGDGSPAVHSPGAETVRLAALDVGTNSTRLLVADVAGGVIVAEHAREMVITRLGKGVDQTGRFDPAALARTLEVLAAYADTCRRLGVERRRLVATSATRDAADRQLFLDGVRDLLGVEAEVLTGQAEAAATYRGATAGGVRRGDAGPRTEASDLDGGQPTLVVDIGGGSTELIFGHGAISRAMVSLDIGCVRLFERHLHTDPPTAAEVAALRADVAAHLARVAGVLDPAAARRVVGVAGTVTTLTAIALGLDTYDPQRIHHATLDASEIAATTGRLAAMTVAERASLPVMAKGREDVIVAGALLLDELVRRFHLRKVVASETDILDGVLLGLAEGPHGG
jgi:exopolyphosphatase / guanosine-5'-triphosphate,3'-diphosphate pyrophosphatase